MPSHYIHLKRCQKGEDVYSLKNDVYKNNTAHTAQGRIKAGTTGTDGTRQGQYQLSKFKIHTQNSTAYKIFSQKQLHAVPGTLTA